MDGEIRDILLGVQQGTVSVDQALLHLKQKPFEDLGYAKVDLHRKLRQGAGEVIYGAGKTAQQIAGILAGFRGNGQENMLITRMDAEKAAFVKEKLPITYYEDCGIGILGENARPWGMGKIVIATGGTSDQRVAEEAARTAEFLGNEVVRLYDVGVSGIHRLLSNSEVLMDAAVVIAIAGMEGGGCSGRAGSPGRRWSWCAETAASPFSPGSPGGTAHSA